MATLHLQNISKHYDQVIAVHDLSLEIHSGELLVLVGPSGCGKSTTLRLIAGLEDLTSGSIQINGAEVSQLPPKDRDIAMVFQNYALYPHMTVAANLGFSLKMKKTPRSEINTRVRHTAQILNIEELLDRKPGQLSGGQMQRVAVGRAMIRNPAVFLFDEPLSNLDAKLRLSTRDELQQLHQRLQATMVYVTHDQVEALTLGDRIAVMHEGKLQQLATPREVYDRPANTFVASFMGSPGMNLIPADEFPTTIKKAVTLGIRPEDIQFTDDQQGHTFAINSVQQTGADTWVRGQLGTTEITIRTPATFEKRTGTTTCILLPQERMCYFDAEGARMETP